jgi:hypothetical protein
MATDRLNSISATGNPFYADDFSLLEFAGQYDSFFKLGLTDEEKRDLIQNLFGPPANDSRGVASPMETSSSTPTGGRDAEEALWTVLTRQP